MERLKFHSPTVQFKSPGQITSVDKNISPMPVPQTIESPTVPVNLSSSKDSDMVKMKEDSKFSSNT